jgi:hypothetical protein
MRAGVEGCAAFILFQKTHDNAVSNITLDLSYN